MIARSVLTSSLMVFAFAANAEILFQDNFDANPVGYKLIPAGWSLSDGTVDIVGPDFEDFLPGHGNYIDLDGTTFQAGTLSKSFELIADVTYLASFDLAGNRRAHSSDIVDVTFGTSIATYTVSDDEPFSLRQIAFTPTSSGFYEFTIHNRGGDNAGALFDNFQISSVPEPETWAMLLAGLGIMSATAKRRRHG